MSEHPKSKLTMTIPSFTHEQARHLWEISVPQRERDLIDKARAILEGLFCGACEAQGAEMAAKCCRDTDCMTGWSGIHCDEVKDWLRRAEIIPRPIEGRAEIDLAQERAFAYAPSMNCLAEIERLERANATALSKLRDMIVGAAPDSPGSATTD